MSSGSVITVEGVTKDFRLPHEKANSLKSSFVNIFRKKNKRYETQHALKGISFEIAKGEFYGILGRNGSGKSTLLKILAEIYQPTKGRVRIDGKLVPFIELGVGFNPELTGRENVYLNGALLGFTKKQVDARYQDIVDFAELERFMDQKLKNYSSGMQVRLAFSVATRAEADILLVDEVLAVGDADFQRKCFDYFKSLKKSGKTVVFVTHDMGAVREYCDKAILIENGRIKASGKAVDIADEYLKLFMPPDTSQGDQPANRWGSRDIVFTKVTHKVSKEKLLFTFDIENKRDTAFDDSVDIGLDFYTDDALVTGTHYQYYEPRGFSIGPKAKKRVIVQFANQLSDFTYDVSINIKVGGNSNVCDEWKNAIRLVNFPKYSKFFRVVLDPLRFDIEDVA